MEKPTIEQMNSVIAEYNGTVEIFNDSKKGKIKLYHSELINSNIGYEIHELKYHSSLDWLYPVYCKLVKEEKVSKSEIYEYSQVIKQINELFKFAAPISELQKPLTIRYNGVKTVRLTYFQPLICTLQRLHEAIYNAIVWLNDNTLNQTK